MSQVQGSSPNQSPTLSPPSGRFNPGQVASAIATYIRALILIVLWGIAGMTVIAAGFLAFRAIWFAVNKALVALGI